MKDEQRNISELNKIAETNLVKELHFTEGYVINQRNKLQQALVDIETLKTKYEHLKEKHAVEKRDHARSEEENLRLQSAYIDRLEQLVELLS